MKKAICILLCFLFIFCIFSGCEQAEESKTQENSVNASNTNSDLPAEESSVDTETSVGAEINEKELLTIIDLTRLRGGADEGLEYFFEDDIYRYAFPDTPSSEFIIAVYSDGTHQNIKEALEAGNITIEDLDTFGIGYYFKEAKENLN